MLTILAQTTAEPSLFALLLRAIASWGLFLFSFAFLLWFSFIFRRVNAKQQAHRERTIQHMDRLESQTNDVVRLLEEIRDQHRGGSDGDGSVY